MKDLEDGGGHLLLDRRGGEQSVSKEGRSQTESPGSSVGPGKDPVLIVLLRSQRKGTGVPHV